MTYVELALAIAAFITGLLAAGYWYKASRATPERATKGGRITTTEDNSAAQDDWINALLNAVDESAPLNAIAARWTASTVILTTLATLASIGTMI